MNPYYLVAVAAFSLHLVWILWVLLGWLGTRGRPLARWAHIASVVYSILIEVLLWPCPLTLLENWALARAGRRAYAESFLIHYLDAVLYPDVPQAVISGAAVAVCLAILGVYAARFRERRGARW